MKIDNCTLLIASPAYGPAGVARRDDGKVVMVHHGVPGDRVRVRITREKSHLAEAEILEVVEPSPHRRTPPCPAWPGCGGCSWIHVEPKAQIEHKGQILARAVRKVAGPEIIAPFQLSPRELGYRRRARLQMTATTGSPLNVGFFAHGSHDIASISRCPVCVEPISRLFGELAALESTMDFSASMEVVADDDGRTMAAAFVAAPLPAPERLARFLVENSSLEGCLAVAPKSGRGEWGISSSVLTVQDDPKCVIPVFPGAFCQANAGVNRLLVSQVKNTVGRLLAGSHAAEILELYAGHGNFTYPLVAAGHRVTAVEVGLRKEFLTPAKGAGFIGGDAVKLTRRWARQKHRFGLVLLDPPRQGAKAAVPFIADLGAAAIVYVSCDPNTFARDAGLLARKGYRVTGIVPFDMVPQTHHIELVAVLLRE